MKVKVIGSHICQDTLYSIMKLKDRDAEVEFLDIAASFPALKEFLELRENCPLYDAVKARGGIGMPYFQLEDGTQTLDLKEVLAKF